MCDGLFMISEKLSSSNINSQLEKRNCPNILERETSYKTLYVIFHIKYFTIACVDDN